jgi:uncharacterized protein YjbI with pentapeptide repeats
MEADLRHSSWVHPCLLHCEQCSFRQREAAGLPYDSEHGKLWQDIKADVDKTRTWAGKFAATAEWVFGKKTARVLGVLALFAVVVALLFLSLHLYVAPTKPSGKKDLVLAVAQILGGTALLSGLYFTWRTLQVNREGQITERFTRAIEQLGATHDDGKKNLELRLGGIYALERIARESGEDHWSIMEILTAYVRQHAPWLPGPEEGKEVDPDIQAIMTVIGRRTRYFEHGEPESLNLQRTDLTRADLEQANLSGANLSWANLSEANLNEAILAGGKLWGANLSEARLMVAHLEAAFLEIANLTQANLLGAYLEGANLSGAHLSEADLSTADLSQADLSGADLSGADLSVADLWLANLSGADLSGADLSGADLSAAHLSGADLSEADLSRADLSEAELTKEQLQLAKSLEGATMPDGQNYEDWLKDKEGRKEDTENA